MRLYYDKAKIVRIASTKPISTNIFDYVEVEENIVNPVGKRIVVTGGHTPGKLRLAVICNWDDDCGISTYTRYLIDALAPKVDDLKIFSEKTAAEKLDSPYNILYCWRRGESMRDALRAIHEWGPSIVLIQHEYGIFPKTTYWLQVLQSLHNTPYVVTLHSVYEHLDKTVATSSMKNIITHTQTGHECLRKLGNKNRIFVIPHGCVLLDDTSELWNTWQTPYPIIQFGFGFEYKGVEVALEAIALLKRQQPLKYGDIFYTFFCSENKHVKNAFDNYARKLTEKIEQLGLQDNAVIVRGFQDEQSLIYSLRTSRLAIFPYITDPQHPVRGASGAIRIAMASGVPVIASSSFMFDDMEGVLARPNNAAELAREIDRVFSDQKYRQGVLDRARDYILENSWETTADRYLSVLHQVASNQSEGVIFI